MKKRLNYYWRAMVTASCYVLFGVGVSLLSIVFALLIRWWPVHENKKQSWLLASLHGFSAVYIRMIHCLGLMNYSHQGPSISSLQGHLIVANHSSLIDVLFIMAASRNVCCIVKAELLRNPFTRYIVKLAGYIPNSSATLVDDSICALAAGKNLLIFPEGTRNTFDDQLEFKRGAANVALSANCPITPVVFNYRPRVLQKGEKWYSIPESVPKITMTSYPALNSLHYVDPSRPVTMQARQLNSGLVEFYRCEISGTHGKRPGVNQRSTSKYQISQVGK